MQLVTLWHSVDLPDFDWPDTKRTQMGKLVFVSVRFESDDIQTLSWIHLSLWPAETERLRFCDS